MVREQVESAVEDGHGSALSVFLDDLRQGEDQERLAFRLCAEAPVRNGKIQFSTVGQLEDAGFTLKHDDSEGMHETHHDVIFPSNYDLDWCQRFVDCFTEPVPNPAK
jgi:hypothetical protein